MINHCSYFDMPVLFYVVTCSAVAMSAVQNVPSLPGPALRSALVDGGERRLDGLAERGGLA